MKHSEKRQLEENFNKHNFIVTIVTKRRHDTMACKSQNAIVFKMEHSEN